MEAGTQRPDERVTFIVGIDLGTTNCAMAFADAAQGEGAAVHDFPIPQLQRPGQVGFLPLLPSCLYAAGEHELPPASTNLPWGPSPKWIAGAFARWQGARVPGRLITSAKSWLCHSGVDRSAPILPWGASPGVPKISPVDASAFLLSHLASAWNAAHPDAPLAAQEVVITLPASFDEAARALTVEAARRAGLDKFTLVEEPQAAFYDFISRHRANLGELLKDVRLVVVADVGGGTTDFTLIQVNGADLRRIAVGDHLMLGGDNMDAALARRVEERAGTRKFSATQWTQLLQSAREAKESLLGPNPPERHNIAVAAEGSRLLGSTFAAEIARADAELLILDGFFPKCAPTDAPQRSARTALQELGLPYAQDPAIPRHLAAFLRQHAAASFAALGQEAIPGGLPRPDAILLNGGVFNSQQIAGRFAEVVSSWWPEMPPVRLLPHDSLDFSVARGAAARGLARHGLGQRIGGGSAHALYAGLAGEKETALCLIPRGQGEGQSVDLTGKTFHLTLSRPVQFPLYSTSAERADRAGDIVEITDEFRALPPIHTLFKSTGGKLTHSIPVHLRAALTELGTLELWCVSNSGDDRWRLEFELRGAARRPCASVTESMPPRFAEARAAVERVFGKQPAASEGKEVKQLARLLERIVGPRDQWRLPMLRELWSTLFAGANKRRRTADHERAFFQLLGFSLRPGFGYPLDDWRCEQSFALFADAVKFQEQPIWSEYWILWRRIAGGLSEARQQELWQFLKPHLARRVPLSPSKSVPRPKGINPEGLDEMVRAAASLEHLDPSEKMVFGDWVAERLQKPETASGPWAWALGRVGARVPLYGSGHKTVESTHAARWISLLLQAGLSKVEGAAFAVTQIARLTGDRSRDIDDTTRARVLEALRQTGAPDSWQRLITEAVALDSADEARALGDTLPVGLTSK